VLHKVVGILVVAAFVAAILGIGLLGFIPVRRAMDPRNREKVLLGQKPSHIEAWKKSSTSWQLLLMLLCILVLGETVAVIRESVLSGVVFGRVERYSETANSEQLSSQLTFWAICGTAAAVGLLWTAAALFKKRNGSRDKRQ
jgi:hypothetical protein